MNKSLGKDTLESMNQAVWYNQWTLNKIKKYLTGDILEVGCGIGNFTKFLSPYKTVWAIDINNEYVEKTRTLVTEQIRVGLGNIEKGKYFFKNCNFDSIVCLNVLEHIKDDDKALLNLYKLLKKKGKLILLVPSHQLLYGEIDKAIAHYRRYSKSELSKRLEGIGFKIIYSRKLNLLGGIGWFIAGKILKQNIVKQGNVRIFNVLAPLILPFEDLFEPFIGTSVLFIAEKI